MNIYGSEGDVTDYLYGTADSDMLVGLGGRDYLFGGDGNDLLVGGAGPDVLVGGAGFDMAFYLDSTAGVVVDMRTGFGYGGTAEGDVLFEIEGVFGSAFNDVLIGSAGSDELEGSNGDDLLIGGDGDDYLDGGSDNDILMPGSGADVVVGRFGNDTVDYSDSLGPVWASLLFRAGYTGDAAGDTYWWIENLSGTAYGDFLQGDNDDNTLTGNEGNDFLWGEDGNDKLVGGRGIDTLLGGAGADTFVWLAPNETGATLATADLISDFDASVDRIDLSAIDADTKMAGHQALEFIGMGDFTAAGQVRWTIEGDETVVWINTDGDLAADAAIRLAGAPLLGSDHFLL